MTTFTPVRDAAGNAVAPTRTSMRQWALDHISLEFARCRSAVRFDDRHKVAVCVDELQGCAGVNLIARPATPHDERLFRQWRAWLSSDQYNGAAAERAQPKPNRRRAAA